MLAKSKSHQGNSSIWDKLVGMAVFAGLFWLTRRVKVEQLISPQASDPKKAPAEDSLKCDEASTAAPHATPRILREEAAGAAHKSTYTLLYADDIFGLGKRIEFEARNLALALEIAECEAQGRRARLFEDGRLLCRIEKGCDTQSPFWIIGADDGLTHGLTYGQTAH